jgi:hypothetical protein
MMMTEEDLRAALFEQRMAAAALGLCIARTIGKSDPTILQRFADEAQEMGTHLCERGKPDAGQVLISFALALAHPDRFPLLTPEDRHGQDSA